MAQRGRAPRTSEARSEASRRGGGDQGWTQQRAQARLSFGGISGAHDTSVHALVQDRFRRHLLTQVALSNMVSMTYYALGALLDTSSRTERVLRCVLALFLACAGGIAAVFQAHTLPRWLGGALPPDDVVLRLLCAEHAAQSAISLACLGEMISRAAPGHSSVSAAASSYFFGPHLALVGKCISLQMPVRLLLLPEAARSVVCLAVACVAVSTYGAPGELSLSVVVTLVVRAACATAASLLAVALCHTRAFQSAHLPAALAYCPAALLGAVNAAAAVLDAAAAAALPEAVVDHASVIGMTFGILVHSAATGVNDVLTVSHLINVVCVIAAAVSLASRRTGGSAASLRMLQRRLGSAEAQAAHAALCGRLACAVNEAHLLSVAAEALRELVPGATAQALAALADADADTRDEDGVAVSVLRVDAVHDAQRKALHAALPQRIALHADEDAQQKGTSSVLMACSQAEARGCIVVDSADWPHGCHTFTDWDATAASDTSVEQCVTAPLMASAGTRAIGFVVLCFRRRGDFAAAHDKLRRFAEAVGAALQVRRAQDAADAAARALSVAAAVARDAFPEHMMAALQTRIRRRGSADCRGAPPRLPLDSIGPPLDRTLMETHACCTVIFADIAGFTSMLSAQSAEAMLELLDALWLRFDALCEAHGVFKVDAASDCYLAVSGLFPPRPDHARAALRLALDLHAAAASIGGEDDTPLRLRVGLHCGAVTSGVVGSTRARLSIFGQVVSVAQQLKRACAAGGILLSRDVHDACGLPPDMMPCVSGAAVHSSNCCQLLVDDALVAASVRALLDAPQPLLRTASATVGGTEALLHHADDGGPAAEACAADEIDDVDGSPAACATSPHTARASSVICFGRSSVCLRRASPRSSLLLDGATSEELSSSSASANAEAEARAAALILERSSSHFCMQLLAASGMTLVHVVMCSLSHSGAAAASQVLFACFVVLVTVYARRAHLPPRMVQLPWERSCITIFSGIVMLAVWSAMAQLQRRSQLHCPGLRSSECARSYYQLLHAPIIFIVWVTAQLPARLMFFPEMLRNVAYIAGALFIAHRASELTPRFAATVLAEGIVCTSVTPLWVHLLYAPPSAVELLLKEVESCPALLRHCRDLSLTIATALRRRLLRDNVLLDMHSTLVWSIVVLLYAAAVEFEHVSLPQASTVCSGLLAVLLSTNFVVRLRPSSAESLNLLSAQMVHEGHTRVLDLLRARLDVGDSEADNLRAGCDALLALFPAACACALGTFAEGAASDVLAAVECGAREPAARAALEAALPPHVGAAANDAFQSSVWRVCGPAGGGSTSTLDSASCEGGLGACSDWHAAVASGLTTSRALTLPLQAGPVQVGFLTLHLGCFAAKAADGGVGAQSLALLREVCAAVAAAVFVRRAFAVNRDSFAIGMRAVGVPDAVATSLQRSVLSPAFKLCSEAAAGAACGSSDLLARAHAAAVALAALDAALADDTLLLEDWGLDAWDLSEEEVCRLFSAMLHHLGLLRRFDISPLVFNDFMSEVAAHYSSSNPFHSFRHAFTVTHTAWMFITQSAMRAGQLAADVDVLALMLSAICHDLEHPGVTNAFQVNSCSVLARRYNDASPNESHHCAVAFELLDAAGVLRGLSGADTRLFRKLAVAAILATDMACHKDLLARVTACLADAADHSSSMRSSIASAAASAADVAANEAHRVTMVAFVLHCADLCCPLLPPQLSHRIAGDLSREFAAQAVRERAASLPVTVMEASSDVAKAKMEIGFLDYICRPLFAKLVEVEPTLRDCLARVDANHEMWQGIIAAGAAIAAV